LNRTCRTALAALCLLVAPARALASDLLSHWVFSPEHVAGGVVEDRAGPDDARLYGGVRVVSAPGGDYAVFGALEDRAIVATSLRKARMPVKAFAVDTWVSIDKPQAWGAVLCAIQDNGGFEKGWLLGYRGSKFCFGLSTEGADDGDGVMTYLTGTTSFEFGRWYHVAAVYDGANMRLFVNGTQEATSKAQSGTILYPRRAVYEIGAYHDDNEDYPLKGLISELRVWRGALDGARVAELHDERSGELSRVGSAGEATELASWVFDETSVDASSGRVTDAAGNPRGTLCGARLAPALAGPAALSFDGRSDGASLLADALPGGALSVEATVMLEDARGGGGIAAAGDGDHPWVLAAAEGRLRFGIRTRGSSALSWCETEKTFAPYDWHHVVATFDGSLTSVIVDGRSSGFSRKAVGELAGGGESGGAGVVRLGSFEDDLGVHRLTGRVRRVSLHEGAMSVEQAAARFSRNELPRPLPLELPIGPVVRFDGADRAEVSWGTREPTASVLECSLPGEPPRRFEVAGERTEHTVTVTGLRSGSQYRFRVLASGDDGRLRASTRHVIDTSFNYEPAPTPARTDPFTPDGGDAATATAVEILEAAGTRRGWCLVLDSGDGRLAYELAARSELKVVAVEKDPAAVRRSRRTLAESGLYGARISVHQRESGPLPYPALFANLIVCPPESADRAEVDRLLRPSGGVAAFGSIEGPWEFERRGALAGAGEWTHQYGDAANSASSGDEHVYGELALQWFGRPGPRPMLDRGARSPAPLSANGRMFVQGDRRMFGMDSYNGTILWTLEIPGLRRTNVPRDCSNTVADDDHLYIALDDHCWQVDGQSGEVLRTIPLPVREVTELAARELSWGYLARADDLLMGSVTRDAAHYRGAEGEWYDGAGTEAQPVVATELFALRTPDMGAAWTYRGGLIVHPTVTLLDGRVFFVEDRAPHPRTVSTGRLVGQTGTDQYLVALELATGRKVWEKQVDFRKLSRVFYLSARDDVLVVAGTSDGYHALAFDANDATRLWEHHHPWEKDHHGGAMQHPVLVGDKVLLERKALDLRTGKVVREDVPSRRGCGTMSASARATFFRDHSHGMWDVETGARTDWEGIRSGCWLSIIPAGGLMLAPESSSGCSCSNPLQTSVAFRPVGLGESEE
jgi:hypothetical protein